MSNMLNNEILSEAIKEVLPEDWTLSFCDAGPCKNGAFTFARAFTKKAEKTYGETLLRQLSLQDPEIPEGMRNNIIRETGVKIGYQGNSFSIYSEKPVETTLEYLNKLFGMGFDVAVIDFAFEL